jgi:hypothetical protein
MSKESFFENPQKTGPKADIYPGPQKQINKVFLKINIFKTINTKSPNYLR